MPEGVPDELPPDFEFGAYVIRGCIGRGGMARIYRAEHGTLRRSVALKVLDRWLLEQPTGGERFLREARAAAAIKHPHVVDILDVGVWCGRPFIVMELLTGCDLAKYLDEYGMLPNRDIASLALPVIAGVMAVHEAGVVHRDLKPSNIFLSKESDGLVVPKVLDFGVSKVQSTLMDSRPSDTQSRDIVGTPAYMAPEGLEGVGRLGPASDQYAIGAVLYECAVGRPPFEGETLLGLLKALAVGDFDRPSVRRPDILPEIERVILRAIEREPEKRFPSLRDMGRQLWPFADERTKTLWEHSFGNDTANADKARTWMEFPVQREEQRSRRVASRDRWGSFKGLMAHRWTSPLAVSATLLLIIGGMLVISDTPKPVASTIVEASATGVQARESSTPHHAEPPPESGVRRPVSAKSMDLHADASPVSGHLATVAAVLHDANAESGERATRGMPRGPSIRRRTVRKNVSRVAGNSRPLAPPAASVTNQASTSSEALDDPFAQVPTNARPAVVGTARHELDGLFPGLGRTFEHGANRAPIPD
jgi:serine/threonine protein kinase